MRQKFRITANPGLLALTCQTSFRELYLVDAEEKRRDYSKHLQRMDDLSAPESFSAEESGSRSSVVVARHQSNGLCCTFHFLIGWRSPHLLHCA